MGVAACGASRVTDEMFFAAAKVLAGCVTGKELAQECIFPPLTQIREASARIAAAVAEVAYAQKLATEPKPKNLIEAIRAKQYKPEYPSYA